MINGNDGGANVSFDGGRSWSRQDNQPTAQMYHVTTDNRFPYFVYGAQQDNTTVAIASASNVGGHRPHPVVPGGRLRERLHRAQPGRSPGRVRRLLRRPDHALRPPHRTGARHHGLAREPDGLGRGGDEVPVPVDVPHRLLSPRPEGPLRRRATASSAPTDEGQTLGADQRRPHAERPEPSSAPPAVPSPRTTPASSTTAPCSRFAESPREKGVLWAGSDDGLVHVSRDGGKTWSNVTPREMPEWSLVSQIDVSPHQDGTAYLATTRYKLDDLRPYAWVTSDYGQTLAPDHRRPARGQLRARGARRSRRAAGSSTRARRPACSSPSTTAGGGSRCARRSRDPRPRPRPRLPRPPVPPRARPRHARKARGRCGGHGAGDAAGTAVER